MMLPEQTLQGGHADLELLSKLSPGYTIVVALDETL